MFSLINGLPSPSSANSFPSLFEWFIGTPPLSDSSVTCTRVLWLFAFTRRPAAVFCRRHHRGLPVLVSEVSGRVRGLRLRRADLVLTISPLVILPSALAERRRRPDCKFSKLNTLPTYPLFYASMVASRQLIAKLGAERIVIPFSKGSFIPCFRPVYPGAPATFF